LENIYIYYDVQDVLGHGGFGIVRRAIKKSDGKPYAIKSIQKDKVGKRLDVL
jgi:serine/threonine protein kinase